VTLPIAGLYYLADDDPRWPRDPVEQARAALAGGARVVQLRTKHTGDREVIAWGAAIRRLTRERDALFVVNDRFDLALACEADGVHLGQDDIPPARVPEAARARLRIGRSTHTIEQARAACAEPIDHLAFGPLFGTTSKESPYSARGLDVLAQVVRLAAPRPVVAIGGIGASNAASAIAAGAAAVCVLSAIAGADDPEAAARAIAAAATAARAR
jgi:thiamine-phosphate pyrophosphorylase